MFHIILQILSVLFVTSSMAKEPMISRQDKTVQIHAPYGVIISSFEISTQLSSSCNMTESDCPMEKTFFDEQDSLIITGKRVTLNGQIDLENLLVKVEKLIKSRAFLQINEKLLLEANEVNILNTTIVSGPVQIKSKKVVIDHDVFAESIDVVAPELDLQHSLQAPIVTGSVQRLNLGKGGSIQQAITLLDDQDTHLFLTGGVYHGDANFAMKPISVHIGSPSLTVPQRVKINGDVVFNRDNALHIGLTARNADFVNVIGSVEFGNVQLRTFKRRSHHVKRGFRFLRGVTTGQPRYVGSIKYRRLHDRALGKRDGFHDVILNIREAIVSTEELTGTIVSSTTLIPRALPTVVHFDKRNQASAVGVMVRAKLTVSGRLYIHGESSSNADQSVGVYFKNQPVNSATAQIEGIAAGSSSTGVKFDSVAHLTVAGDLQIVGDCHGGAGIYLAGVSQISGGSSIIRGSARHSSAWGIKIEGTSQISLASGEISATGYLGSAGLYHSGSSRISVAGSLSLNGVYGDANPSLVSMSGILVNGASTITASTANVTGKGYNGCEFSATATLTSSGALNMNCLGTHGSGYLASGLGGAKTTNGDLYLNASASSSGATHGISVSSRGLLEAGGIGKMTLIAQGSPENTNGGIFGVNMYAATINYGQGLSVVARGGGGTNSHGVNIDGGNTFFSGNGPVNIQGGSAGTGYAVMMRHGAIVGAKDVVNVTGTLALLTMAPYFDMGGVANISIDKIVNLEQTNAMIRFNNIYNGTIAKFGPMVDVYRLFMGTGTMEEITLTNFTNMKSLEFKANNVYVNGNISTIAHPKTQNSNVFAANGIWTRGVTRVAQTNAHIYFLGDSYPGRLDAAVDGKTLTLHTNPFAISNVTFPDGIRLGPWSTLVAKIGGNGICDGWFSPQNITLAGTMEAQPFDNYVYANGDVCQFLTMNGYKKRFVSTTAGYLEEDQYFIKFHSRV